MIKLNRILEETFQITSPDYSDSTEIMQLKEWDSMTHMLLITRIEENYQIQLTGEQIASIRTIGDIQEILKSNGISEI